MIYLAFFRSNKKMGFAFFKVLLLPIFLFYIYSGNSAVLHVILVGDTIEGGPSTECSIDLMHREARRIAAYTDMRLDVACFEGYHTTQRNVLQYLHNLEINSKDVVLLCFFMHGSREPEKISRWPNLHFPLEYSKPDFESFVNIVKNKKPKLLIALADSCNIVAKPKKENIQDNNALQEFLDQVEQKGPTTNYFLKKITDTSLMAFTEDEVIENYRKLFTETTGSIIISSASPGQPAQRNFLVTGGVYTLNFLEAFRKLVDEEETSWEEILELSSYNLQQKLEVFHLEQTPQFELDLALSQNLSASSQHLLF